MNIKYSDNKHEYDKFFKKTDYGFRTKNSNYFRKIMNFVGQMLTQANINIENDGLKISTLDQGHVALVNMCIPNQFFGTFNLKRTILGVHLPHLNQILSQLKQDDELIFKYKEQSDFINLIFKNPKYTKEYKMKLLEIDEDNMAITQFDNTTKIIMESKYFNDIVKDFISIGDNIDISIKEDNIEFKCDGTMIDLVMELNMEELLVENIQSLNYQYCLKYFDIFSKCNVISKHLFIEIGNETPLKLSFKIFDHGFIEYYVAPKMEEDDEDD